MLIDVIGWTAAALTLLSPLLAVIGPSPRAPCAPCPHHQDGRAESPQ